MWAFHVTASLNKICLHVEPFDSEDDCALISTVFIDLSTVLLSELKEIEGIIHLVDS